MTYSHSHQARDEDNDAEVEHEEARLQKIEELLLKYDTSLAQPRALTADDRLRILREQHQIHLHTEQIRIAEIVFQPHMVGVDQAGLGEVLGSVLQQYDGGIRAQLAASTFVTGGSSLYPGFRERVAAEMQCHVPQGTAVHVTAPSDPLLAAWTGAGLFARSTEATRHATTRAEYAEHGAGRIAAVRWW